MKLSVFLSNFELVHSKKECFKGTLNLVFTFLKKYPQSSDTEKTTLIDENPKNSLVKFGAGDSPTQEGAYQLFLQCQ